MTREEANDEVMTLLAFIIAERPSQRFGQVMRNYGFITEGSTGIYGYSQWNNEFYLEPQEVIKRVKNKLKEAKLLGKYHDLFGVRDV